MDVGIMDGQVVFDQLLGHVVVRAIWDKRDAKVIGEMLVKAAEETGEQMEIVRESGLVVAKEVPNG